MCAVRKMNLVSDHGVLTLKAATALMARQTRERGRERERKTETKTETET